MIFICPPGLKKVRPAQHIPFKSTVCCFFLCAKCNALPWNKNRQFPLFLLWIPLKKKKKKLLNLWSLSSRGMTFHLQDVDQVFPIDINEIDNFLSPFISMQTCMCTIQKVNYLRIRNCDITPSSIYHVALSTALHLRFIIGESDKSKSFGLTCLYVSFYLDEKKKFGLKKNGKNFLRSEKSKFLKING